MMEAKQKRQFEELLRSEEYTDFTIACCQVQWKVHRSILSARSGFFRQLFRDYPNETVYDPHIPLGSQTIVDLALQVIYTGDYSLWAVPSSKYGLCPAQDPAQAEIICHSVLRRFAEVWQIPDLRDLTIRKEEEVLRANIETVDIGWIITPYYLGWRGTGYMPTTTSWVLGHRLNLVVMRQNRDRLMRRPSFESILKACPDFATDLNGEYDPLPGRMYISKTTCNCQLPHNFQLQCAACKDTFLTGRALPADDLTKPELSKDGPLVRFDFPDLTENSSLDCPCPFPTDAMFVCSSCGGTMCKSVTGYRGEATRRSVDSMNGVKKEDVINDHLKTES